MIVPNKNMERRLKRIVEAAKELGLGEPVYYMPKPKPPKKPYYARPRSSSNPNEIPKPRKRREIKPYLLPTCPIEYAKGVYQSEGTFGCDISTPRKIATPKIIIAMKDKEALKPLEPCFGTSTTRWSKQLYALERAGQAAINIAQTLATTPTKQKQIAEALQKCKQKWQQSYRDRILL